LSDYTLDYTLKLQDPFVAKKTKLQQYCQKFRHKNFLSSSKPRENTADFL